MTQQWGSTNGGRPYFTPGAFKDARAGWTTAIYGPCLWIIAKNWYAATDDMWVAAKKAVIYSAAWKAWGFGVFMWFFNNWWIKTWSHGIETGRYDPALDGALNWMSFFNLFFLPVALLAAYRQLIDKSLMKRRLAYRIAAPIDKVLWWVPWPVLINVALLPAYAWIIMRADQLA